MKGLRDLCVATVQIEHTLPIRIPDPPGSGEMRKVGEGRQTDTITLLVPRYQGREEYTRAYIAMHYADAVVGQISYANISGGVSELEY